MNNKLISVLAILSATTLVACAGGGDKNTSTGATATPMPTRIGVTNNTSTTTAHSPTSTNLTPSPMSFVSPMSSGQQASYLIAKPNEEQIKQIQEAIKLTNAIRAKEGLPALKYDEGLSAYAQMRATELAKNFSHTRPNGEQAYGYIYGSKAWTLENIAAGVSTASGAIKLWENSKVHRWAMINKSNKTIGIGLVYIPNSQYGYYWVQMFGYEGASVPFAFSDTNNTKPLQQVVVNGVTLSIPQKQGTWQTIQENGYTAEINGYQSMRFGAVKRNHTRDVSVFYQGLQTHERAMPTTGTAKYQGQAVVVQNGQMNTNVSANFNVDYGKKTLNGALSQNNKTLYNLNANIQGSSFASPQNAKVQTQGAFFGSKAEELGGVFKDTQSDTKGAFGAVKQQ